MIMSFRVVSGIWKSRRVSAPKHFTVRPTTDFAKEALFSIIENKKKISGASVLDLFSGLGSISLEFASRGATQITAVDLEIRHIKFLESLTKDWGYESITCIKQDAIKYLQKLELIEENKLDFIFADPPFDIDKDVFHQLLKLVIEKNILVKNGLLIIEHNANETIFNQEILLESYPQYEFQKRTYGNIAFCIFQYLGSAGL